MDSPSGTRPPNTPVMRIHNKAGDALQVFKKQPLTSYSPTLGLRTGLDHQSVLNDTEEYSGNVAAIVSLFVQCRMDRTGIHLNPESGWSGKHSDNFIL